MPLINNFTNQVTRPILEIRNIHFYAWLSQAQAIQKRSGFIILSTDQAIVCIVFVSYCIVSCCIVLETKTIFMLYLLDQMILPFHFSSTMFVQYSFDFTFAYRTV